MLYFLLRVLFIYLFIRFVIKAIYFFTSFFVNRAKQNNRDKNHKKTKNQPFNCEDIVDAEFKEVE